MRAGDRGIPGSIFSPRGHEGGCLRSDERKCHTMLSHWSEVLKENTSFSETYQVLENANRTHPFVRDRGCRLLTARQFTGIGRWKTE